MKKRGLVLGLLIMLAVVVSGFTYAFWANGIDLENQTPGTVTIGTGRTATIGVTTGSTSGVLVPSGQTINSVEANAIESFVFTLTVTWNDDAEAALEGTLTAVVEDLLVGGEEDDFNLVNVSVNIVGGSSMVRSGVKTVTITITLNNPTTQAEYDAVAGQEITFNVNLAIINVVLP